MFRPKLEVRYFLRSAAIGMLLALLFILLLPIIQFACGGSSYFDIGLTSPACHEHEVSSLPHADTNLFEAVVPNRVGFDLFLAAVFVSTLFLARPFIRERLSPRIRHRLKYLRWIWARSRPFSSSKTFLPYFAPVRDAWHRIEP